MAVPVWNPVTMPRDAGIWGALEAARKGMVDSGQGFQDVLTARQAVGQATADRARQAMQEDYLNVLQGMQTPQALAEARSSGVLDQKFAALDPRNQAMVRDAFDKRLLGIQTQIDQTQKFDDGRLGIELRDIVNQAKAKAAGGDIVGSNALMVQAQKHPKFGEFVAENEKIALDREKTLVDIDATKTGAAANTANAASNTAQIPIAQQNANTQAQQTNLNAVERLAALAADNAVKVGAANSNIIGSAAGRKVFMEAMKLGGHDEGTLSALDGITGRALIANPEFSKLPVSVIKDIASSEVKDVGKGFVSWVVDPRSGKVVDRMVKKMTDALAARAASRLNGEVDPVEASKAALEKNGLLIRQMLGAAQGAAFPGLRAQQEAEMVGLVPPGTTPSGTPFAGTASSEAPNEPSQGALRNLEDVRRIAANEPATAIPTAVKANLAKIDKAAGNTSLYTAQPNETVGRYVARILNKGSVEDAAFRAVKAVADAVRIEDPAKKAKRS